ncbi:hypothetical protein [Arthrobacter psychrochitiniphilus]|uniref:hypothetical protein n=1 Tax=Arthrobacter psychrochitiniphilus TaxID=291045 RepID=UPI003F7C24A1
MAYPMSRAVLGAKTVPVPTSPVVWAGYVVKTWRACALVVFLWALAVSMLGFFSPVKMSRVFEDVSHFLPALLFVIGVVGAVRIGHEIGKDVMHVLGYGDIKVVSAHAGRAVVPERGRRIAQASVLVGLFLGTVAAAIIRAVSGDWLEMLLLIGLSLPLLVWSVKVLRLARIMWLKAREEHRIHWDIIASGQHTVGTVVAVTNEKFLLDNRAMFHVDVEYLIQGRMETSRIRFFDYTVWAPAIGNEFDVWVDPERPFVQERILLERRYVGQKFAHFTDLPVPGVHASEEDLVARPGTEPDGTVAGARAGIAQAGAAVNLATVSGVAESGSSAPALKRLPQWMADETAASGAATPRAARRTRILIGIPPNLIAVLALIGTLLVPPMVQDVPWWTLAALWLYTVLTIINAAIYWQFMLRSRWFIRSGVSFGATEAAVFAGFFAAGFAMLSTHSMVMAPLNREIPWTAAHVLTWAAVIGALLVFEWAFTSNAWALRHLNAEFPAPPEVIQEALTGHDPDGVDKLEKDYGYRAGVFLCT